MGMVLFARAGVEIAVLETGLGGKLDATNTVERPVACVITSISLEHTEYLGDTVEAIAGEKAGIIKPGAAVIYEGFQDGVSRVIEEKAAESGNRTIGLKPDMYEIIRNTDTTIDFSLKSSYYGGAVITIPFVAPYQVINASLALLTLEVLAEQYNLPLETIRRGIRNTRWEGRMETVLPGVIVDGAHNDDGVRRFVETAKRFEDKDITLLFSAVVEKDYPAMIHRICSELHFSKVVTTQIDRARVVPAEELADLFRGNGCENVTAKEKIEEAFDEAYEEKGDGLLFCVGSMTVTGSIQAGLTGDNSVLITKAMLDLVSSMMLASSLGIGVMLAAVSVFVIQGGLVLFAGIISPLLSAGAVNEMTCAGSLLIIMIGTNLMGITKIKVADFLPAIIFAPVIYNILPLIEYLWKLLF